MSARLFRRVSPCSDIRRDWQRTTVPACELFKCVMVVDLGVGDGREAPNSVACMIMPKFWTVARSGGKRSTLQLTHNATALPFNSRSQQPPKPTSGDKADGVRCSVAGSAVVHHGFSSRCGHMGTKGAGLREWAPSEFETILRIRKQLC